MGIHKKCLINWLTEKVEGEIKQAEKDQKLTGKKEEIRKAKIDKYDMYINQFMRSTAGSIVASYILDLGDRHSGNILIQEDKALLFHIDFGHILGHKKKKLGWKREVEPFIYLEEMHQLINYNYDSKEKAKKNFEDFQELCCEGFKIARENFILFHNLLTLLIPANIDELDKESIEKTMKNFLLEISDNEAKYAMRQMIKRAHLIYRRRCDNWFRLHCEWTKNISNRWYYKCLVYPLKI